MSKRKTWVIGNGIMVPDPDDLRWAKAKTPYTTEMYNWRDWLSIGGVYIDLKGADVVIDSEHWLCRIRGFKAWRYARAVRKMWDRRCVENRLEEQRQVGWRAISGE